MTDYEYHFCQSASYEANQYREPIKPDLKGLALQTHSIWGEFTIVRCDSLSSHKKQGMQIAIKNERRVETAFSQCLR